MKLWVPLLVLATVMTMNAPPVAATCAPGEIDYVVNVEYKFSCPDGTFHGIHAVDFSQQEPALRVCFGGFCEENCGPIIFTGTGEGTVSIMVLKVHQDPNTGLEVCTGTAGTIYING